MQLNHALLKLVPDEVLIKGKDVRDVQLTHALLKYVPDEVSIKGKDVREAQLYHALLKFTPDEVSIKGKDVREVQLNHALLKLVTLAVSTLLNSTISPRPYQKVYKLDPVTPSAAPLSIRSLRAS